MWTNLSWMYVAGFGMSKNKGIRLGTARSTFRVHHQVRLPSWWVDRWGVDVWQQSSGGSILDFIPQEWQLIMIDCFQHTLDYEQAWCCRVCALGTALSAQSGIVKIYHGCSRLSSKYHQPSEHHYDRFLLSLAWLWTDLCDIWEPRLQDFTLETGTCIVVLRSGMYRRAQSVFSPWNSSKTSLPLFDRPEYLLSIIEMISVVTATPVHHILYSPM